MVRKDKEAAKAVEYNPTELKLGDLVRCAGCDKELGKLAKHREDDETWSTIARYFSGARMPLPKRSPVVAFVCQTGMSSNKKCVARAWKNLRRCPGCGRGPKEGLSWPHGSDPGRSLCGGCRDALDAGYGALADRGDVQWHSLCTKELFDAGDVPQEAFAELRQAAQCLARVAAGPGRGSADCKWEGPRALQGWHSTDPPTVPSDVPYARSEDPVTEIGPEEATALAEAGAAIGRAMKIVRATAKREGSSILSAILRSNGDPDPYVAIEESE